jgi:hypothetical protein
MDPSQEEDQIIVTPLHAFQNDAGSVAYVNPDAWQYLTPQPSLYEQYQAALSGW